MAAADLVVAYFDGSIGAGKTTLIKRVKQELDKMEVDCELRCEELEEDWKVGGLFAMYYQDPRRRAFQFQTNVVLSRLKRDMNLYQSRGVVLIERSLIGDKVFATIHREMGNMDESEIRIYDKLASTADTVMSALRGKRVVEISYYVDTSVAKCLENIQNRARQEETSISCSYLQKLHDVNEAMLSSHKRVHWSDDMWDEASVSLATSVAKSINTHCL